MSFSSNLKALARTAGAWSKNHAPELLLAGGAVSFVATVITASKATIKAQDILEEHREALKDLKTEHAISSDEQYPEEVHKKDVVVLYSQTGLALAKDYALPVGFATVSLTCFFASYGILKKRYIALGAAYTALNESFALYRQRVVEDRGSEADTYYLTGVKPSSITVTDEEGNKEKKKVVKDLDGNEVVASPYMFKFSKYKENGERNLQWQNDARLNLAFLTGQEHYLDDQLYMRNVFDRNHDVIKRGCVFLNELRDIVGEDATTTGAVTGWRYSNGEPGCNGYISLNLVEGIEIDPETGNEIPVYYINPNVDGLIYDLVEKFEPVPFTPNLRPGWDGDE